MKEWKKIGPSSINLLVRASAKGGSGVYLYIPRDHADSYGIVSGSKLEIRLLRMQVETPDKEPEATDLSEERPRRKGAKKHDSEKGAPKS